MTTTKTTTTSSPKPPAPFHKQLPKKLVRLLREVADFIVEHPRQYDQDEWVRPKSNTCQTVGCIAGHMALLDTPVSVIRKLRKANPDIHDYNYELRSLVEEWRAANIPAAFFYRFDSLFDPSFASSWNDYKTKSGNLTAHGARRRILHFLETGK